MKKAVEPKRLEKKARRRVEIGEEKAKAKEEREQLAKTDDALLLGDRTLTGGSRFEDAYQSDDSHDEIMKTLDEENKLQKKEKSKKIKKNDVNELAENIQKIQAAAMQTANSTADAIKGKMAKLKGGRK